MIDIKKNALLFYIYIYIYRARDTERKTKRERILSKVKDKNSGIDIGCNNRNKVIILVGDSAFIIIFLSLS